MIFVKVCYYDPDNNTPLNMSTKARKNPYLILGAPDAMTARICRDLGADYIWASSFVLSSLLGSKDNGMVDINRYIPIIEGLIAASPISVILDLDICGRNRKECLSQLEKIKKLRLGGVCIEDEGWPKVNAMLESPSRKLISPEKMAQKIIMTKKILKSGTLVIEKESLVDLQNRIDNYTRAGADILCIHYTGKKWQHYQEVINKLRICRPLMVIFSKSNFVPKVLNFLKIKYILFPNQIYRMMMRPILDMKNSEKKFNKYSIKFNPEKLIDTKEIFNIFDKVR